MPYKNNRNSREDKSFRASRFEKSSKNDGSANSNSRKKKMFEGDRNSKDEDRFSRTRHSSESDRKPAGRQRKDSGSDKPAFRDQKSGSKAEYKPKKFNSSRREGSDSFHREGSDSFRREGSDSFRSERSDSFRKERSDSFRKEKSDSPRRERSDSPRRERSDSPRRERSDSSRREGSSSFRSERSSGRSFGNKQEGGKRPFGRSPQRERNHRPDNENRRWTTEERIEKPTLRSRKNGPAKEKPVREHEDELIRLNRYIANAGICSRRKADELIEAGVVSVNGEVISELGYKINPLKDVIRYNGEVLKREKMVYVLLNKPKDYITTTDDPQERKTVMQLVEKASGERIYPVGRLDRNTTGLLLMTNDGDLAEKLSHPRNSITKIYQVELDKSLNQGDLNKIAFGLELEDGLIKPDAVSYVQGGTKRDIGIQIHSGKNRVVRRIFEHLGYEVVKLDRVVYANLTKKDLPRGRWRYLEEKEIIQLKHLIK